MRSTRAIHFAPYVVRPRANVLSPLLRRFTFLGRRGGGSREECRQQSFSTYVQLLNAILLHGNSIYPSPVLGMVTVSTNSTTTTYPKLDSCNSNAKFIFYCSEKTAMGSSSKCSQGRPAYYGLSKTLVADCRPLESSTNIIDK